MSFLRNQYVFGVVKSRRLGNSLGVNVLPIQKKVCNFNCIYCECGWNSKEINQIPKQSLSKINQTFPSPEIVKSELFTALSALHDSAFPLDVITFSGNGEPTLHPQFEQIIDNTIEVRNAVMPAVKIAVLSNATRLSKSCVLTALSKVDKPILKLDSANDNTLELINLHEINNEIAHDNGDLSSHRSTGKRITVSKIVSGMQQFNGNFILQIMFLRGTVDGTTIDNTTEDEIQGLLDVIKKVAPKTVMIYPIDRQTPAHQLEKLTAYELQLIATKIRDNGFDVLAV